MRKNRFGTCLLALILVAGMFAGTLTGCARELTEEQSAALVGLQSAVTYYETTDKLTHWEELVALAAANRADGIGVNWNALTLPDTPEAPILTAPDGTDSAGGADGAGQDQNTAGTPVTDSLGGGAQGADGTSPAAVSFTPIDVTPYPGAIIASILKGEDYGALAASLVSGQNPVNGAFSEAYVNQHVWSMITLTAAVGTDGYDYDKAAAYLLTFQRGDGGFGYAIDATESDVDLTGIASVALAPYYSKHKKAAEMKALTAFYKENQKEDGGYEGFGGENPSTIASAIWGLSALKQELPTTEDGLSPVNALLAFQNEDGSFRAAKDGDHVFDAYSTRQAMIALCDVVNDVETYVLLADDAESYRIQNVSGPAITLSIDYPDEADAADVSTSFKVEEGSSALDALILYGKIKEIPVAFSGGTDAGYVQGISGVMEKDYGDASGWTYKVNGESPQQSASAVILKEGDVLSWIYVKDVSETIMQ